MHAQAHGDGIAASARATMRPTKVSARASQRASSARVARLRATRGKTDCGSGSFSCTGMGSPCMRAAIPADERSEIENKLTAARIKIWNYLFACGSRMRRPEFERSHLEFEELADLPATAHTKSS